MSQTITKDNMLKILEGRFDYQSARNVMERAIKDAGLGKKDSFDAGDLDSICSAMTEFSTGVTSITEALRNTLGGNGAAPAPKASAKAPAPKDAKKEAKADDKKDAKAPAKEEKKADPKKSGSTRKASAPAPKKDAKADDKKADDKKDDDKKGKK